MVEEFLCIVEVLVEGWGVIGDEMILGGEGVEVVVVGE